MREIEFRGKRLDNSQWITGNLLTCEIPTSGIPEWAQIHTPFAIDISVFHADVDPRTVGQFTGLLDKNGKKIYEGDILKEGLPDVGPYRIAFENGSFVCYHKSGRWGLLSRAFEIDIKNIPFEIEVIANIYDNSELIIP